MMSRAERAKLRTMKKGYDMSDENESDENSEIRDDEIAEQMDRQATKKGRVVEDSEVSEEEEAMPQRRTRGRRY